MSRSYIKQKLCKSGLLAALGLSVFCIIGNLISGFPLKSNAKWLLLLIVSAAALLLLKKLKNSSRIMFFVFIFLEFIFLPFAFFDSGGSSNNAIGYTFLMIISIAYLFSGRRRTFLAVSLIAVFVLLHILEYFFPQLVAVFPERTQFIDRIIQIPVLLLAAFLITLRFSKEYERVNRKLNSMVSFDELTGLYNRRMFNKAASEVVETSKKSAHLALIDLDNFKKVNDRYGHHVGDEVLKKLSVLLQQSFDLNRHVVSRWGGDEFAIIFFGDKSEMVLRLEEVRKAFLAYAAFREKSLGLSVSIVSFDDYEIASQTFLAADRQLYKEKSRKSS